MGALIQGETSSIKLHRSIPGLVVESNHVAAVLPRGADGLFVHIRRGDPRALWVDARKLLPVELYELFSPLTAHLDHLAFAERDHLGAHASWQRALVLCADLVDALPHGVQVGHVRKLLANRLLIRRLLA